MTTAIIIAPVEAPHVMYPKGPARKIRTFRNIQDAIAGDVVLVVLEPCGHNATIIGKTLTTEVIVRCPICFYEAHRMPEQVIEDITPPMETAP